MAPHPPFPLPDCVKRLDSLDGHVSGLLAGRAEDASRLTANTAAVERNNERLDEVLRLLREHDAALHGPDHDGTGLVGQAHDREKRLSKTEADIDTMQKTVLGALGTVLLGLLATIGGVIWSHVMAHRQ